MITGRHDDRILDDVASIFQAPSPNVIGLPASESAINNSVISNEIYLQASESIINSYIIICLQACESIPST